MQLKYSLNEVDNWNTYNRLRVKEHVGNETEQQSHIAATVGDRKCTGINSVSNRKP